MQAGANIEVGRKEAGEVQGVFAAAPDHSSHVPIHYVIKLSAEFERPAQARIASTICEARAFFVR